MNYHLFFVILFLAFIFNRVFSHRVASASRKQVDFVESRLNLAVGAFFGLGYIIILVAYGFYPPLLEGARLSLPSRMRLIGGTGTLLSVGLIWWMRWALGIQFDTNLHVHDAHQWSLLDPTAEYGT